MSITIQSPVVVGRTDNSFVKLAEQASTGRRINSAADDAAGAAISQRLGSRFDGLAMAARNIGDGLSMLRTRTGMASGLIEQVQRMRELSIQANSGILNPQDRIALNREFVGLRETVVQQLGSAEFNGRPLFSSTTQTLQTGSNAGQTTVLPANNLPERLESLEFSSLSLAEAGDLGSTISALDDALAVFVDSQVQDGALANRLESQADSLAQNRIDTAAARSRVEDKDIAELASELAQTNVKDRVRVLLQSQANAGREDVLRLLTS